MRLRTSALTRLAAAAGTFLLTVLLSRRGQGLSIEAVFAGLVLAGLCYLVLQVRAGFRSLLNQSRSIRAYQRRSAEHRNADVSPQQFADLARKLGETRNEMLEVGLHLQHLQVAVESLTRQGKTTLAQTKSLEGDSQRGHRLLEDLLSRTTDESTLNRHLLLWESRLTEETAHSLHRLQSRLERSLLQSYRQYEATEQLHAIIPVAAPIPASRGWAASPDLLLHLLELIQRHRPTLILECGSGLSTLWMALALRRFGIDGKVVSLEHEEIYRDKTMEMLQEHGVSAYAEIRHAPLQETLVRGQAFSWYARQGWQDLKHVDMLVVDGPPASTGRHARYPALPLLRDSLAESAIIVLDDMIREDEQEVLALWLKLEPKACVSMQDFEKKCATISL